MTMSLRWIPLALALTAAGPAPAGEAEDFAAAEALFQKAAAGDGSATEPAVAHFTRLATADAAAAPLYQAYLGAAQALEGRDAWMPWTKLKATERGLASLDKALRRLEARHDQVWVRQVPVSVETRLVAATTFLAVPGFFNRLDAARDALKAALASPAFAAAPPAVQARLRQQQALAEARAKGENP